MYYITTYATYMNHCCTDARTYKFACELCHTHDWANMHNRMCTHVCWHMPICCMDNKYACMHTYTHVPLNVRSHKQILVFVWLKTSGRVYVNWELWALNLNEKWKKTANHYPNSFFSSFLLFYSRSETSREVMRVKVQPSFSQEDMLNEVECPEGKQCGWLCHYSEMAADAETVFCFAKRRSSIWSHRSNLKANYWHANYIGGFDKHELLFKTPQTKRQLKKSPTIKACESYQEGSVIIFPSFIPGLWSHGRGVQWLLALCVIVNRLI